MGRSLTGVGITEAAKKKKNLRATSMLILKIIPEGVPDTFLQKKGGGGGSLGGRVRREKEESHLHWRMLLQGLQGRTGCHPSGGEDMYKWDKKLCGGKKKKDR